MSIVLAKHWMEIFVEYLTILLEFFGAVIIIVGAVIIFVRFIQLPYHEPSTSIRLRLERTLALALEFYLAAEILKTVTIHDPSDLITLGVIVVLRSVMALMIHWEMGHDMHVLDVEKQFERNVQFSKHSPEETNSGD